MEQSIPVFRCLFYFTPPYFLQDIVSFLVIVKPEKLKSSSNVDLGEMKSLENYHDRRTDKKSCPDQVSSLYIVDLYINYTG